MENKKYCSKCGLPKDKSEFGRRSNSKDGLNSACNKCLSLYRNDWRNAPKIEVKEKRCRGCGDIKPAADFNKDKSCKDGRSIYCKKCRTETRDALNPCSPKMTKKAALNWIATGKTGLCSMTMWCCFMGAENFKIYSPCDPNDFDECYKLIKQVPRWRNQLFKLKSLSEDWSNMIANWSKLTAMYEKNEKENWKNSDEIGMYEFMQTLIK